MTTRLENGFSLIELLIVVVIIAIIAAIAEPNLEESRRGANEASAIGALRTILSAQIIFHERNSRYGESLGELAEGVLIADNLADGRNNGYLYDTQPTSTGFRARAYPAELCETGRRFFYVDQTGVQATRVCGTNGPVDDVPPFVTPEWPPQSENCACPRDGDVARTSAKQLRLLAPVDLAKDAAAWSSSSKNVDLVLFALDSNGDQKLSFDEITKADALAIAREIAAASKLPPGPTIGPDRELNEILSLFRSAMESKLLFTGDEELPMIPLQGLKGDASKWLSSSPPLPIGILSDQSTRALRELINLETAENLAMLRTGACSKDVRDLWALAPALRITGDRFGYDYGIERCGVTEWSIFAQAHGQSGKRPSFRIDQTGTVAIKP